MKLKLLALVLLLNCSTHVFSQTPVKLSTDQFRFLEGPVWDGTEYIYFSEVNDRKIHKYSTLNNTFELAFDNDIDGCNGLMFDKDYKLIICEARSGKVTRREQDGTLINNLASTYNGSRFNSPNDLCIDKKGGVYFTDPAGRNNSNPPQTVNRIYYITPANVVTVADDGTNFSFPNGVIISPDGKRLLINDSDSNDIYQYDIDTTDGSLSNRSVFATINNPNDGNPRSLADGMAFDTDGNLYVATKQTVQIFNANGIANGSITFPETVSNITFGGTDKKTLYATTYDGSFAGELYAVTLTATGFQHPFDLPISNLSVNDNSKLSFSVFPNPSNNHTVNITVGNIEVSNIALYNEIGQKIEDSKFNKANNAVQVSLNRNLKKGIYFLYITTSKGVTTTSRIALN